jgi:hypothetical protein
MTCARAAVLAAALAATPGCLVLNMHPAYDADTIAWEPALVGSWRDVEDNVTVKIDADEWKSYRIRYVHPIESGDLTAYLTIVGGDRYLDVTPVRGKDFGSFLTPVHASLRVRLESDKLEVTPLSYDWFVDRSPNRGGVPGLAFTFDRKQNALIISPTAGLRKWLRQQPPHGRMFGAAAVFMRQ